MIKFVCSGCQERLSVPDQFAGRKGLCPTCRTVNRIPVKGTADEKPPVPESAPLPSAAPPAEMEPVPAATSVASPPVAPTPIALTPVAPMTPSSTIARAPERASGPVSVAADPVELIRRMREASEAAVAGPSDETVRLRKERRLPRPLKMALLVIAVIAIGAALYSALYFALHAFLKAAQ